MEDQIEDFEVDSQRMATSNKIYIRIISFGAMGVITVVAFMSMPLLVKLERDKIYVLKFFNMLHRHTIDDMVQKGLDF